MKLSILSHRLSARLVVVALLAAAGCQKGSDVQPGLPAATAEGRNTIGCMIDNEPWLVGSDANGSSSSIKARYSPGMPLEIEATHASPLLGYSQLRLRLDTPALRPGTYTLADGAHLQFKDYEFDDSDDYLAAGNVGEGSIILTKVLPVAAAGGNAAYTIVAGTYACTVVSPTTGAVLHLTDGRFDLRAY